MNFTCEKIKTSIFFSRCAGKTTILVFWMIEGPMTSAKSDKEAEVYNFDDHVLKANSWNLET